MRNQWLYFIIEFLAIHSHNTFDHLHNERSLLSLHDF